MKAKKNLLILTVLLTAFIPAFAAAEEAYDLPELGNSIIPYVQLDIMCSLSDYLSPGEAVEMQKFSADLDVYYKNLLFDRYSQDPWGIAVINLFTGGMGSLMNGNVVTGSILQAGFLASYTFMVLGLAEQNPEAKNMDYLIAEIGAVVFGVAGLVLPFLETSIHNDALKESLNL